MAIGDSRPQIVVLPPQGINSQPAMDPSDSRPQYVVIQNGTQPTMVPMDPEINSRSRYKIAGPSRSILSLISVLCLKSIHNVRLLQKCICFDPTQLRC